MKRNSLRNLLVLPAVGLASWASAQAVGNADWYAAVQDSALNVGAPGVLGNDVGAADATEVVGTCNGVLSFYGDGSFDYTPDPGFWGLDSFVYTPNPAGNLTAVVLDVDALPVVTTNNGLICEAQNSAVITQALLETSDPDNGPGDLLYTITNGPGTGFVTPNPFTQADINGGLVSYTHTGGVSGAVDSFDFTVCDGEGGCANGTLNITITPLIVMQNLLTIPGEDGWVRESSEFSSAGGFNSPYSQFISIGDAVYDRQYLSILSFDTSTLPPGSVVIGAQVTLHRVLANGNPASLGDYRFDVGPAGVFGATALQNTDFESPAAATNVAIAPPPFPANDGDLLVANLGAGAWPLIDNANGRVQIRVYQAIGDNDNGAYDYVSFGAGNHKEAGLRPTLKVTYFTP